MVSERVKVHIGLAAALLVLIVCFAFLIIGSLSRGDMHAALRGSVAPDFFLRDADNKPVALSDLRGNVVIVYFPGQTGNAIAPTTENSVAAAAGTLGAVADHSSLAQATPVDADLAKNAAKAASTADLAQLTAMCEQLRSPHLKVLELSNPLTVENSNAIPSAQPDPESAVQKLLDPSGDVARKYRVDNVDTKPTFFIIDPSGVIRYRGSSLQSGNAAMTDELLSPATQPSSCPQLIQTLLSSEALNLGMHASGHF
jgi:peroxiredoxin